jgi:hypothetical protein
MFDSSGDEARVLPREGARFLLSPLPLVSPAMPKRLIAAHQLAAKPPGGPTVGIVVSDQG